MGTENPHFLYDPALTYAENLEQGPFDSAPKEIYQNVGEPEYDFFDTKVYAPFGIAAGPLPRAHFIEAVLKKGFDIVTFKSVRSSAYPCHPPPNVIPLALDYLDPQKTDEPIATKESFDFPLSAANSYGIPSFDPIVWQPEIRKSFAQIGKGQAMLVAFQGTDWGKGRRAFIEDHVKGVKLLKQTGARIVEVNLSCPNEGSQQLLCLDEKTTRSVLEEIHSAVPDVKLVAKIAYFEDKKHLRFLMKGIHQLIEGVTAINTVPGRVVDSNGAQAFSGSAARTRPGISGAAIRHLGLEMVRELHQCRQESGYSYKVIGVGGVQSAQDFQAYRQEGADIVMSLTGAMWKPELAAEVKAALP